MTVPSRAQEADEHPAKRRKVAVIGSGLAGLTTAYLLVLEGVEVWLIEKSDRLGFHSASVHIPVKAPSADNTGSAPTLLNVKKDAPSTPRRRRKSNLHVPWSAKSVGRSGTGDMIGGSPTALRTIPENRLKAASKGKSKEEEEWAVDVPMRSFQGGYYPLLISLYHHLGLPLIPCDFTFSFSRLSASAGPSNAGPPGSVDQKRTHRSFKNNDPYSLSPYFLHSGSSGLAFPALPHAAYSSPSSLIRHVLIFLRTAICYLFYLLLCFITYHSLLPHIRETSLESLTSRVAYRLNYPLAPVPLPSTHLGSAFVAFITEIVIPLFSAVGTMSHQDVLDMPMGVMADYVHATIGTRHWRLSADTGAREVGRRLITVVEAQGEGHVRLGEAVSGMHVVPTKDGRRVKVSIGSDELVVDTVVLATPASVARTLLKGLLSGAEAAGDEKDAEVKRLGNVCEALQRVRYQHTTVVTHRDPSQLPPLAHDVKDINLVSPLTVPASEPVTQDDSIPKASPAKTLLFPASPANLSETYSTGTHHIRPPAHFGAEQPVLQSTNPILPIFRNAILAEAHLERALPISEPTILPIISPSPLSLQAKPLILIAGSYAYPGLPLLEGCVGSAIRAVDAFNRSYPHSASNALKQQPGKRQFDEGVSNLGGVDWDTGSGGTWGKRWRWRRRKEGLVF